MVYILLLCLCVCIKKKKRATDNGSIFCPLRVSLFCAAVRRHKTRYVYHIIYIYIHSVYRERERVYKSERFFREGEDITSTPYSTKLN